MAEETRVEDFSLEDKLVQSRVTGQKLQTFHLDGADMLGLTQEIDTSKLGTASSQTFSLVEDTNADSKLLLAITSGGKPVASFEETEGKVQLFIDETFFQKFKEQNPEVVLEPVAEYEGSVAFEVEKLKLSSNLQIEDVQVKAASSDFAMMFSALGLQVKDADGKMGKIAAPEDHFDVIASTAFVERALSGDTVCSLDKTEPAYSAVMISRIQFERQIADEANADKIIDISIPTEEPQVKLYSVPVVDDKGKRHYLNIKQEDGKTFAYLHVSTEANTRARTKPRFFELDSVNLEANADIGGYERPSLYLGLKDDRKNVTSVHIDLDFTDNAKTISALQTLMPEEFAKAAARETEGKAIRLDTIPIDGKEFALYSRPAHAEARIISFDDVANLSRRPTSEEPPVAVDTSETVASTADGDGSSSTDSTTHIAETTSTASTATDTLAGDSVSSESKASETAPPKSDEETPPKAPEEKKEEKKEKKEGAKLKDFSWLFMGLGILFTILSCVMPVMAIGSWISAGLFLLANLGLTNPFQRMGDVAMRIMDEKKNKKAKLKTLEKSLEKAKTKEDKARTARAKVESKLNKAKADRQTLKDKIARGEPLTKKERKQLKKLDKEISDLELKHDKMTREVISLSEARERALDAYSARSKEVHSNIARTKRKEIERDYLIHNGRVEVALDKKAFLEEKRNRIIAEGGSTKSIDKEIADLDTLLLKESAELSDLTRRLEENLEECKREGYEIDPSEYTPAKKESSTTGSTPPSESHVEEIVAEDDTEKVVEEPIAETETEETSLVDDGHEDEVTEAPVEETLEEERPPRIDEEDYDEEEFPVDWAEDHNDETTNTSESNAVPASDSAHELTEEELALMGGESTTDLTENRWDNGIPDKEWEDIFGNESPAADSNNVHQTNKVSNSDSSKITPEENHAANEQPVTDEFGGEPFKLTEESETPKKEISAEPTTTYEEAKDLLNTIIGRNPRSKGKEGPSK